MLDDNKSKFFKKYRREKIFHAIKKHTMFKNVPVEEIGYYNMNL